MSSNLSSTTARILPLWLRTREAVTETRAALHKMQAASEDSNDDAPLTICDQIAPCVNRVSDAACSLSRLEEALMGHGTEDVFGDLSACFLTVNTCIGYQVGGDGAAEALKECSSGLQELNETLSTHEEWPPKRTICDLLIIKGASQTCKETLGKLNNDVIRTLAEESLGSLDEAMDHDEPDEVIAALAKLVRYQDGNSLLDRMTTVKMALESTGDGSHIDENWTTFSNCIDALESLAREYSAMSNESAIETALTFEEDEERYVVRVQVMVGYSQ
jgi:hypothetical protein